MMASEMQRPIFIVGMQRSGTSLMRALLSSHPEIAIAPAESRYFEKYQGVGPDCVIDDFGAFWEEFARSRFFQALNVDEQSVKKQLTLTHGIRYKVVLETMLRAHAAKEGKARWGEKTPSHERYYKTLFAWFPAAQVIHMLRDPRGVIASLLTVDWDRHRRPRPYVDGFAARWREGARLALASRNDARILVVQYEHLVRCPEQQLHIVCRFLGERFASEMVRRQKSQDEPQPRRPDARGAITAASIERWRDVLTNQQVAIVEHMTRREMVAYGYTPLTENLPASLLPQFIAMRTTRHALRGAREVVRVVRDRFPILTKNRAPTVTSAAAPIR